MPSTSALSHGDQVAQYVISNAGRLGIKYIIWKQRIWDVRSGSGRRRMEDRGGVTHNHFDHPHVSVLQRRQEPSPSTVRSRRTACLHDRATAWISYGA
jgi:hypothetical protein